MNAENRIDGLRRLIREKCQENNEYEKILSQYESYRIKFLEDIEKLMEPAHSLFSTDSESDSYDEENSESSSDANYGAPTSKKKKKSNASDTELDTSDYLYKQKNENSAHSSPQLSKLSSVNFSPTLSSQQNTNLSPLRTKSQQQTQSKTQSEQKSSQKLFKKPDQIQNLHSLIKKLCPDSTRKVKEKASQNEFLGSSITIQRSQSAPTTTNNSNVYIKKDQNPTKEIKHHLLPSKSVLTPSPQKFQGTIPGHFILNEGQGVYSFSTETNDTKGTFLVGDSKVAQLIAKYRNTLELLQQQQFVNLLYQFSLSQIVTIEVVDMAYKLIYQNTMNCKSNFVRDKYELSEQNPDINSYLKMVAKNSDDKGTNLFHMNLLESKLSLWSKINQKTPDQFIVQFAEVIKPSETVNLIERIDIQSMKSDEKINQDFTITDESDVSMFLDDK